MQATRTSAEIAAHADLSDEARSLVPACPAVDRLIEGLRGRGLYADALAVAYHSLPRREAAWWGTLCLWYAAHSQPAEDETAALHALVRWVQDPTPERLNAVGASSESARGMDSPAGRLALSAASDDPVLAASLAVSALLLASARAEPLSPDRPRRAFLELAHDLTHDLNLWK